MNEIIEWSLFDEPGMEAARKYSETAMTMNCDVLVHATDADSLYEVEAWLRDTYIPAVRPLYNVFKEHQDNQLKAATLSKHLHSDGKTRYILTLLHGVYLKSFEVVGRSAEVHELANQGYIVLKRSSEN